MAQSTETATTPLASTRLSQRIPFNRPWLSGRELGYVDDVMSRRHFSGDGTYTKRCNTLLEELHAAPKALLTTSCTHALEMAALLLDVGAGDEVIVPAFTFVSTVNAFILRGATPVFADVRPDTLNLDERLLPSLISERTRAIVPVHYAGIACEMHAIMETAGRQGVVVVEDNAHGFLGAYRGRRLGTFGALSTLSFHETKNFVCGEGGALVINDGALSERAEIIREKGTDRSRFFRGQVDKYTWVDVGSSYLPSEILAAVLLAQLEARDHVQAVRRTIFARYREGLSDWGAAEGVRLPTVPDDREPAHHMYYLLLPSLADRAAMIEYLEARGIGSVFHYLPLHLSPMGRRFGGREGQCPVTEEVSDRLVRLPFHNELSALDQDRVIDAVRSFDGWAAGRGASRRR
ncbi:MAG: dTDP-4-amino-4,6-dideoxygalactose transaminase [Gemmatimonadota bacterium]|nr:dTDP-4-amino-4,6-dideoxygalactose transaminase [Gemmatimonadota bacterium]